MIAAAVTSLTLAEPLPRRLSALSGPQNFTLERVGGVNYGEDLYRVASLTPAAPAAPLFTTCDPPAAAPRGRALSEELPLSPVNATTGLRAAEPVLWAWLVAWLTLLGVGLLGAAALLWAGRDAPPELCSPGESAVAGALLGEGGVHVGEGGVYVGAVQGGVLLLHCSLLVDLAPPAVATCAAAGWLAHLGVATTLGAVLAKLLHLARHAEDDDERARARRRLPLREVTLLIVVGGNAALFFVLLVARVAVGGYAVDEAAGTCDARGAFAVLMPTIVGLEISMGTRPVPHDVPHIHRPATSRRAARPTAHTHTRAHLPSVAAVVLAYYCRSFVVPHTNGRSLWLAASTAALLLLFILPAMLIDATDPSSAAVRGGWLLAATSFGLHATHYCLLRHLFLPAGRVLAAKADAAGRLSRRTRALAALVFPPPLKTTLHRPPAASGDSMSELSRCSLRPSSAERGSVGDRRASRRISLGHAAIALNREEVAGIDRQRKEAGRQRKESDHRRGVEEARELQLAQMRLRDAGHRDAAGVAPAPAAAAPPPRPRPPPPRRPPPPSTPERSPSRLRGRLESCRRRARPRVTRRRPTRRRRRRPTTTRSRHRRWRRRRRSSAGATARNGAPAPPPSPTAAVWSARAPPPAARPRPSSAGRATTASIQTRRGSRASSRFAAPATATGRRSP